MRNAMLSIVTAVVLTSTPAWAQIALVPAERIADVCTGDLNGDEVVNSADLASILGSYGICRGCDEDLNHDGYVDETDVKIMVLHWGPCASDEDVITESGRLVADISDDPEVYEGDVSSDQERERGESPAREYRFSLAAAADQPEVFEGDVSSDEQQERGESPAQQYRFSTAAASEQPEVFEGDVSSDEQQERGESPAQQYRFSLAAAADQPEVSEGDVGTHDDTFSDLQRATCEGDLDRNGQIDSADLAILLGKYGRCSRCEEDLNGDGIVDDEDVDILLGIWGKCQEQEEKSTHVSRTLAAAGGNDIGQDLPSQNDPVEEEPQCLGDLDGDGTIDSTDLAMLLSRYGRCYDCEADLTGDSSVDQDDIDVLMTLWGDCAAETPRNSSPKDTSPSVSLSGR